MCVCVCAINVCMCMFTKHHSKLFIDFSVLKADVVRRLDLDTWIHFLNLKWLSFILYFLTLSSSHFRLLHLRLVVSDGAAFASSHLHKPKWFNLLNGLFVEDYAAIPTYHRRDECSFALFVVHRLIFPSIDRLIHANSQRNNWNNDLRCKRAMTKVFLHTKMKAMSELQFIES